VQPDRNSVPEAAAIKCLWIARNIPYPADTGAKVYSAKLAESLAITGVLVRFLGFGSHDSIPESASAVEWVAVNSARRSEIIALFSRLPNAAAIDATSAYRLLLEEQLREHWDAIVLDNYSAGWALDRCLAYCYSRQPRPVLAHVSHNHEAAAWHCMASQAQTSLPRRIVFWQNAMKVSTLEQRIVRSVDLLSAITEEDCAALLAPLPRSTAVPHNITLTPGFAGTIAAPRTIDNNTPRRVAIVGSFHWVMKQENLRRFVESADASFARRGIQLDVIGDMPPELRAELQSRSSATHFHGFVDDPAILLAQARMAIVPELIGGGFKLKFLDYLFARAPIATLAGAAAGLPQSLRGEMLVRDDVESLVAGIVAEIDDFETLNRRQRHAFDLAQTLYRWEDRGRQLNQAIMQLHRHHRRPASPDAGALSAAENKVEYGRSRNFPGA